MKKIAVTGGIGSGKSMVSGYLARHYDLPVIDVDLECKNLLLPGREGLQAIKTRFGNRFIAPGGYLDRIRLREALFADASLRREVDRLIHPLARRAVAGRLAELDAEQVIIDVPLLFEAGWRDDFHRVIVVFADRESRCRRIMERDRVSRRQAELAIEAQLPLSHKASLADHVIDNSFCRVFTRLQTDHLAAVLFPGRMRRR